MRQYGREFRLSLISGQYFRRMRARLGAPAAITAAAHKIARILYHLITTHQRYDVSVFAVVEQRPSNASYRCLRSMPRISASNSRRRDVFLSRVAKSAIATSKIVAILPMTPIIFNALPDRDPRPDRRPLHPTARTPHPHRAGPLDAETHVALDEPLVRGRRMGTLFRQPGRRRRPGVCRLAGDRPGRSNRTPGPVRSRLVLSARTHAARHRGAGGYCPAQADGGG